MAGSYVRMNNRNDITDNQQDYSHTGGDNSLITHDNGRDYRYTYNMIVNRKRKGIKQWWKKVIDNYESIYGGVPQFSNIYD